MAKHERTGYIRTCKAPRPPGPGRGPTCKVVSRVDLKKRDQKWQDCLHGHSCCPLTTDCRDGHFEKHHWKPKRGNHSRRSWMYGGGEGGAVSLMVCCCLASGVMIRSFLTSWICVSVGHDERPRQRGRKEASNFTCFDFDHKKWIHISASRVLAVVRQSC
ncbi:hypothetical protein SODALDRAFT_100053 [Sodiomyces alkalinus F11]|uniref:Uncharacterized protein n=1 Tax=Sodiomyces alkalinus (strain CBS 110278 / VKM F-3762 / F11) TaxID=1314773 RepID=A0A3N2Q1T9_SODAK|nr:hypothetical protein SODALDRAFT_100053 [Sodiomyces alkalinus F11]ROT40585.1 hypothetical protein SODALDRAFT_100053 [Sodiomyces alkalinus F11]